VLCAEPLFEDWFGMEPEHVHGKTLWALSPQGDVIQAFVERASAAAADDTFREEDYQLTTKLNHAYSDPVEVRLQVKLAGQSV
jgi:hypothetical protein